MPPFSVTVVVNVSAFIVMEPDAGAVAFTLMSGVMSVAFVPTACPGENGPG